MAPTAFPASSLHVRYARCLSSETMKHIPFKRKVRGSGSSYREKFKRTKTSDIVLLERFPQQIISNYLDI